MHDDVLPVSRINSPSQKGGGVRRSTNKAFGSRLLSIAFINLPFIVNSNNFTISEESNPTNTHYFKIITLIGKLNPLFSCYWEHGNVQLMCKMPSIISRVEQ